MPHLALKNNGGKVKTFLIGSVHALHKNRMGVRYTGYLGVCPGLFSFEQMSSFFRAWPARFWGCLAGVALLQSAWGQGGITTPKYSNEFLAIGVGARAMGMAGSQTALAQDVYAGYWNPAGLTRLETRYEGALMHASLYAGIANYDYGAFATQIDSASALGISFIRLGVDDIADTRFLIVNDQIDYSRIRRFSAADQALILSYARKGLWLDSLSAGASAKIIYRNAGTFANAWGFGLDLGLLYKHGNWRLGLMGRDITGTFNAWAYNTSEIAEVFTQTGNTIPESSIEVTLPRWTLGIARTIPMGSRFALTPTADLEFTFDGQRNVPIASSWVSIDPRAGLELHYRNIVYLRGGAGQVQRIKTFDGGQRTTFQPNFGLGFRWRRFALDYALTNAGNVAEALYSHVFSLKAQFE